MNREFTPSNPEARTIARSFARMAATEDGKRIIGFFKAVSNWDEAGPIAKEEGSVFFWLGQRSIMKAALDQIEIGNRLLNEDE